MNNWIQVVECIVLLIIFISQPISKDACNVILLALLGLMCFYKWLSMSMQCQFNDPHVTVEVILHVCLQIWSTRFDSNCAYVLSH